MKIKLESVGVTIDTGTDLRAVYEAFQASVSSHQYNDRIVRHLSMMALFAVFMHALKEIADGNVQDPSNYSYKSIYDATKLTPEFIAHEIGYADYGKLVH